jgi:hypothetical protein
MTAEKAKNRGELDILKNALSDKNFLLFLDKNPDKASFDPSNLETVKEQWEAFSVSQDLKKLYSTRIKEDLGLELDEKDLAGIDIYLGTKVKSKNLKKQPEEIEIQGMDEYLQEVTEVNLRNSVNTEKRGSINDLAGKIELFNELSKRIEAQKSYIYGQDAGKLKKMEALLSKVDQTNKENNDTGWMIKAMWKTFDLLDTKDFKWREMQPIDKKENESKLDKAKRYGKYASNFFTRTLDLINIGSRRSATSMKKVLANTPLLRNYLQTEDELSNTKELKERYEIEPEKADNELKVIKEKLRKIDETKQERKLAEVELARLRQEIFANNLVPPTIIKKIIQGKIDEKFGKIAGGNPTGSTAELLDVRSKIETIISVRKRESGDKYNKSSQDIETFADQVDTLLDLVAEQQLNEAINNNFLLDNDSPFNELEGALKPFLNRNSKTRNFITEKIKNIINDPAIDPKKITLLKMLLAKLSFNEAESDLRSGPRSETLAETSERIKKAFG